LSLIVTVVELTVVVVPDTVKSPAIVTLLLNDAVLVTFKCSPTYTDLAIPTPPAVINEPDSTLALSVVSSMSTTPSTPKLTATLADPVTSKSPPILASDDTLAIPVKSKPAPPVIRPSNCDVVDTLMNPVNVVLPAATTPLISAEAAFTSPLISASPPTTVLPDVCTDATDTAFVSLTEMCDVLVPATTM